MRSKNRRKRINKNVILIIPVLVVLLLLFSQLAQSLALTYNIDFPVFSSVDTVEIPEATEENGWNLILVNKKYSVPDNYEIEFTVLSNGERVDKRIYPDLQDMMDDARGEGLSLFVADGYRSFNEQKKTYNNKYNYYIKIGYSKEQAKQMTEYYVALPGTSEHQLGIGLDINADTEKSSKEEVYSWLENNSWKYGFVKRYAEDKTKYTGILNEPWHFRYVGKDAAQVMYKENLCLEEYIEQIE